MKLILLYFSCVFFIACKPNIPVCSIELNAFLEHNSNRVFETNRTNGFKDEFRDKGYDSTEGGYYFFYPNGKLKYYYYLKTDTKSIYKEQFDSLGMLMYEDGNPLVHKSGELIADSLIVKFYFFMLKKKYRKIDLKISKSQTVPLHLSEDTLFSNMQSANTYIMA